MRPPALPPARCSCFPDWACCVCCCCCCAFFSSFFAFLSCCCTAFSSGLVFLFCCSAPFSAGFADLSGCAFFSSCGSRCSCWAYAGAATPRVKDRTAVPIIPIRFIRFSCRSLGTLALAQASRGCVDGIADGLAGNEKFHSSVLLPTGGIVVGGYWQGVAEAPGGDRIRQYAFLHQIVAYRSGAVFRQRLIHGVAAHIVGVAADFNVES